MDDASGKLADLLDRERDLTVITNSIPIIQSLGSTTRPEVISLGGTLRKDTMGFVDEHSVEMLDGISVDVLFMGCDGVTAEWGFSTPFKNEVALKSAMIRSARRTVMMFDHTKIGQDQLFRFAETGQVDVIITGVEADVHTIALLNEQCPTVITV